MRKRTLLDIALGFTVLAGNLSLTAAIVRYWRGVPKLTAVQSPPASPESEPPSISVIIPARNEQIGLRQAAESLLAQDYAHLELVIVDDRSTDNTGQIVAELAAAHPGRVRAIAVEQLPDDWLGKNHALWLGAQAASGDWLLFTDADIHFRPGTLGTTVAFAESERLDHLTLVPGIEARGYWLRAFVAFILYAFVATQKPYLAADRRSGVGMGVGAFNLIRRSAYQAIGTHEAISLRPDDDMRLGQRVKHLGYRQAFASGTDLLRVEWYPTLWTAIRGMEKNQFANVDYSVPKLIARSGALFFVTIYPYLAVWRAQRISRQLHLAAIGVHSINYMLACQREGEHVLRYVPALPLTALFMAYAVLRSGYLTIRHGGVSWRETFYPLASLRRQTGLEVP